MSLKEMREQLGKVGKRIADLRDKAHDDKHTWTAEDEANWAAANEEFNGLLRKIEIAERADQVKSLLDAPPQRSAATGLDTLPGEPVGDAPRADHALALRTWCRMGSGQMPSDEEIANAKELRINLNANKLDIVMTNDPRGIDQARRALSAVDGSSGGYTVPEGFINRLEEALLMFGGMREAAEIIRTDSGADLPYPVANDTSNEGEYLGESVSAATELEPAFGAIVLKAYKCSSKVVRVPTELLEDSAFDIVSYLGRTLGERIARKGNREFTVGAGASGPTGITVDATTGVTTAAAAIIKADELLELVHSVDPAYRIGARWMLNDATLLYLRKLKDGNGNYLWQQGLAGVQPNSLCGFPYTINPHMASITNSAITAVFGQLSAYKIREVRALRMYRLSELYRLNDQDAFVAFMRNDGKLVDAGTNPVKRLVQLA